jgi:hypothetical protein
MTRIIIVLLLIGSIALNFAQYIRIDNKDAQYESLLKTDGDAVAQLQYAVAEYEKLAQKYIALSNKKRDDSNCWTKATWFSKK